MKGRWLLFIILMIAAPLALAQNGNDTIGGFFSIPQSDISQYILGFVFDNVGNVLYSPVQSNIFKGVLVDFNNAVLVLGAIIIIYSLLVSTINTANEGEMLGKQWNSAWIPLRAAGGFALLLPTKAAGGYAIIQVFIMWVILQGVGAADAIWTHALTAIKTGEATAPTAQRSEYYTLAGEVFSSQTCMYQYTIATNIAREGHYGINDQNIYSFDTHYAPVAPYNDTGYHYSFSIKNRDTGRCGSITKSYTKNDLLDNMRNNALIVMMNTLNSPARNYVTAFNQNIIVPKATTDAAKQAIQDAATTMSNTLYQFYVDQAKQVAEQGSGVGTIFGPTVGLQHIFGFGDSAGDANYGKTFSSMQHMLDQAQNFGWMMAGGYYLSVANYASAFVNVTNWVPGYKGPNKSDLKDSLGKDNYNTYMDPFLTQVQALVSQSIDSLTNLQLENAFGGISVSSNVKHVLKPWLTGFPTIANDFIKYINDSVNQWSSGIFTEDPVKGVTALGAKMIAQAQAIWGGIIAAISVVTGLSFMGMNIIGSTVQTAGMALSMAAIWFIPFVLGTIAAAFVNGVLLSLYIPLIPYLIFTFGAIGWLVLAIESMVAGPLLALGILHPEGQHQVWGRAEAGVMILASAFLRPALMVAGFFAAIPLSYGVVGFVNFGFAIVLGNSDGTGIFGPIALSIFISIYTLILILAFNRIFSLIHVLPDKVMRWLGIQEQGGYSAAQELQQMQSTIKESGEKGAQAMQASADKFGDAGKQFLKDAKGGGGGEGGGAEGG